jgi:membrane associated rhomboid family serine protease
MILPLTHERTTVSKLPWVSFVIIGLCFVSFFATLPALQENSGSSERLQEALAYYFDHPYLKLDPRLVPPESKPLLEKALAEAGRSKSPFGSATSSMEQAELDRLTQGWIDGTDRSPIWRNGLIPARIRPHALLTHMFLHGGWLHLLGNLFFFYLLGPFVEDVWGRKWFTAFYLTAGLVSGLLYAANYPHLYRPLIGASGAIAGVMGAFVVLHGRTRIRFFYFLGVLFGTFRAPAWVMLPLWFLGELFSATSTDRMAPGGLLGGTAYWAHVWGFLFGLVAALVMKRFKVGEIDDSIAPLTEVEVALDDARVAEAQGDLGEAWRALGEALRREPANQEVAAALWEVAVKLERAAEVAPLGQRLVRAEIQAGALEPALTHWRQLRAAAPQAVDLPAAVRLMEECVKRDWQEDATDVLRAATAALGPEAPLGLAMKIVRLAAALDKSLHQDAVEKTLQRTDLTPELRQQLDDQFWRVG